MTIDEFRNVELRIATILAAERVEGSEKLIKLSIDLGEKDAAGERAPRQLLAGIGKAYAPEVLVGRQIVVVANLDPRTMLGLESQGMLLAAHDETGAPILLMPDREAPAGSDIG